MGETPHRVNQRRLQAILSPMFSTRLLKLVVIPLYLPTMFAAPSVAIEMSLLNLAFLSLRFAKMNCAKSFPDETGHELMNRGSSATLPSKENLTEHEIKCSFLKRAVSTAME